MLAAFGFITTGLIVATFADTFAMYVAKPYNLNLWRFSAAYYCIAMALLVWGIVSVSHSHDLLQFAVLLGDALLLAATVLFISLAAPAKYNGEITLVTAFIALALLCQRAIFFPSHAAIQNGVLLFHSQRPVEIGVAVILTLIWLPINVRVGRVVGETIKQPGITNIYTTIYGGAVFAAIIFVSAHRTKTVVLSFFGVALMFGLLVISNYSIKMLPATKKALKHGR
jgi:hypothetical protein